MKITEIIKYPDGKERKFQCDMLELKPGRILISHRREKEYSIDSTVLKKNGITLALYIEGKNYNLWKIFSPENNLRGYYFNVCQNVRISNDKISWEDLILDLWINSKGEKKWLDSEEVREFKDGKIIDKNEISIIRKTRKFLENNYSKIIKSTNRDLFSKYERKMN